METLPIDAEFAESAEVCRAIQLAAALPVALLLLLSLFSLWGGRAGCCWLLLLQTSYLSRLSTSLLGNLAAERGWNLLCLLLFVNVNSICLCDFQLVRWQPVNLCCFLSSCPFMLLCLQTRRASFESPWLWRILREWCETRRCQDIPGEGGGGKGGIVEGEGLERGVSQQGTWYTRSRECLWKCEELRLMRDVGWWWTPSLWQETTPSPRIR